MHIARLLVGFAAGCIALPVIADGSAPMIAVTDLAYTRDVVQYFSAAEEKHASSISASGNHLVATSDGSGTYVAGSYSYVEQRELGGFVNDIKGALLKGGNFRLVQGKAFDAGDPQPTKAEQALNQVKTGQMSKPVRQPEVRDIISRIKKGEFHGADYVLFGSLSDIQFVDQFSPLQESTSATYTFGLELVADFSLIDTKSYEIRSAFSAHGSGKEVKVLSNRGDRFVPNRGKVIRQTSQALAGSVYGQLTEQLRVTGADESLRIGDDGTALRNRPVDGVAPVSREHAVILR